MTKDIGIELVRPGIAYSDGDEVIDLTDEEAAYVLAHDPRISREWRKWLWRSGQGKLPPEERSGRIILIRGDEVIAQLNARSADEPT